MPSYRRPDWIKASIALIAMGSITVILFAVISNPFGEIIDKIDEEATDLDMIVNDHFDVVNPATNEVCVLTDTPTSIKSVKVQHKITHEWQTVDSADYSLVDKTVTVDDSALDTNSSIIGIKYIKGSVGTEIDPFLTMLQTIFGVTFALSLIGLILWFFLGSHEEEHEDYIKSRQRPPGGDFYE